MPKSPRILPPIGATMRRLRIERGLSQEQLATRAGLNRGTIAKIETGQRTVPSSATLSQVARALGVEISMLMGGAERENPFLHAFLGSPWAAGLAEEGRPVSPKEKALLLRIIDATWREGRPTPQTLFKILVAIRENPGFTSGEADED